ncbi:unnamed protein product [Caenorhabditis bovis]|uniref:Fas-binding factor 1 C-terminal domain-containing protein n=1 Tax=Caenorhabditis bovis TaxID=2654633 RepID=A0A8S1ELU0_9PELO|nr:unnamed protein product [Caenorhabditis bovis]
MADDDGGIDDLLEGMDDLDAALFGKNAANRKPQPRNALSSMLDRAPSRSAIDSLFGGPSTSNAPSSAATPAPRQPRQQTNLSDLFGDSRREEVAPAVSVTASSKVSTSSNVETPPTPKKELVSSLDTQRIHRLEAEIERLNRELDDLKRRKRDDEEDLERIWKDRIDKVNRDHAEEVEQIKSNQQKIQAKLEEEHKTELERLKSNYDRQLECLTSTLGENKNIINVVEKVDNISTTIEKIAGDVSTTSDKLYSERELLLRIREEKLEMKEEKLRDEISKFAEEREKVHELNIRLNDLCKQQEGFHETEKWKVREEWRKLQIEKELFQKDQQFILSNIEAEKSKIENKMSSFYNEQHELLMRVSNERNILEREKNEFYSKRNMDIKRIKDEAACLDAKIQQILTAEAHFEELKTTYDSKMRQLQDLEVSLMEECKEMDRIRNQLQASSLLTEKYPMSTSQNIAHRFDHGFDNVPQSGQESNRRTDSVRVTLRKNADLLEKYVGQKVAAVAPNQ